MDTIIVNDTNVFIDLCSILHFTILNPSAFYWKKSFYKKE